MGIYRRVVYRSRRLVVEFEMDRKGMREVARGKELRAAVRIIAERGKAYAESISPERSGNYKRSFQVAMSRVMVAGMRRVAAKVVNTDPAAVPIEVGTAPREGGGGTPAHRVLQRTLAYLNGVPGPRQQLSAPSVQRGRELASIPTVAEFRERQRTQRERDRRYRRRRRNWRADND